MNPFGPSITAVTADETAVRRSALGAGRSISLFAAAASALFFAGCATYRPLPLPTGPDLTGASPLTVPAARLGLPGLAPHPINPGRPLDETSVIILAVLNNPELKARRLEAGVAKAQLLEAGLLPDPQISGSLSRSATHGGYSLGLAEDIRALITRPHALAAARARQRQVNLEILWQEWQVAARAEQLFIRSDADRRLQAVLTEDRDLMRARRRADAEALRRNEITAGTVSADLAALAAVETRLRRTELELNQTHHALAGLLGLNPDAPLRLGAPGRGRPISAATFRAAVAALPRHRADLLALKAGYQSREQRLREAILAQFPSLSAGVEQARSAEEGVRTIGLTVNLTLPLFNRNRGRIAVGRATRAELRQAYQARLDRAVVETDRVRKAIQIMERHDRALAHQVSELRRTARAAEQELRRGDLDLASALRMHADYVSAQAESIRSRAALEQARATLRILLALPFADR